MKKFTLIELLVVVAIIGILASMLLPSLSRSREIARIGVCKSNQHQFYTAALAYSDGSDEYLPVIRQKAVAYMYDTNTADGINYYKNFVIDFGIDNEVLDCPSSPMPMKHEGSPWDKVWSNYNFFTGLPTWYNSYGSFTSESPIRIGSSENKWMMIVDRTYKDKWDAADDWRNHGTAKKGGNQTTMDGATKFYYSNTFKFYHSHWTARREYYWYQDTTISGKAYTE